MTNPNETEVSQRRTALFDAIRATLAEQGSNVEIAGTAPVQQIVNFDLDDEHWTMTVNKIPD
jgi:hypothetical protein